MVVQLQPGDVFLVSGNDLLASGINFFQCLWSKADSRSRYNHAGIIINSNGDAFETTEWRTSYRKHLPSLYNGKAMVAIFRWNGMNIQAYANGMSKVRDLEGRIYPYFRLILHAIGLARFIHWKNCVCSEIVSKFLYGAGGRGDDWWGVNPDNLEEELTSRGDFTKVYEGFVKDLDLFIGATQ